MSRELFALFSVPWDGISVSKFSHGERDMDRGSMWFAFPPNKQDVGGESKQITLQAALKPVWHNPVIVYRYTDRLMGKCVTSDGDCDAISEQMISDFFQVFKNHDLTFIAHFSQNEQTNALYSHTIISYLYKSWWQANLCRGMVLNAWKQTFCLLFQEQNNKDMLQCQMCRAIHQLTRTA